MSNIKQHFVSRFPGGKIVEMDYSQLEVIGLAVLSRDPQLKEDIRDGKDLHCVNTASLYETTYEKVKAAYDAGDPEWTKKRKTTKPFSFQLQYGAGAKSMAEDNGVELKFAQKFIDNYYGRYPRVKEWQEENIEIVKSSFQPSGTRTKMGYPADYGYFTTGTGRTYQFTEYDAPDFMKERGIHTSFSPTQIKNYPVQGFSTGDVVPLAFGEVVRYIVGNNLDQHLLCINTIHDSILFDVCAVGDPSFNNSADLLSDLGNLKKIMMSIPDSINNLWPDIQFDLPLHVDAEWGDNWAEMSALDLNL
jgi:DNA polymerase I-like protein with 3'-5' exonuclease and polymerase domains